ncbi:MAG TPA: ubiquinol-cytochrome C chaperone family protein [Alphaproteobacteria bacterium]|jgi:cytochrome b pre-mRNA-processing protein 3|nr:ubiquinol-cytochrome C chaperone family protein [Alphaproteobacteria bacterium]
MLARLARRRDRTEAAHALYLALVRQAREPAFYSSCGVPDSLEGRFDMIVLHAFLIMRRLRGEGEAGVALAQALFDVMFSDMDQNLRELGVGDLAVGRRVKTMARGFYGRVKAYDEGLEQAGDAALIAALDRNLYANVAADPAQVALMAAYVRRAAELLAGQDAQALVAGRPGFPPAPGAGTGA